ncbi:hypothetical protein HY745_04550 [Candidatus Desantisbacteria bacterium]|nr:hypothetical protein [Candidatus Desantisbacteria bacterium]
MKITYTIIAILALSLMLTACNKQSSIDASNVNSSNDKECVEPHNPYEDGSGHHAGFEWAKENGRESDGNSDSFNEGSAEYIRQLNEYNECMANKRK